MESLQELDARICLSLDKRKEEWQSLFLEFEKIGCDFEQFICGNGNILPNSLYDRVDTTPPSRSSSRHHRTKTWRRNPGSWNAFQCYIQILVAAIEQDYNAIGIFEDDVRFNTDIHKYFHHITTTYPDWDMIYFGYNNHDKRKPTQELDRHTKKLTGGAVCWHAIAINNQNNIFYSLINMDQFGPIDLMCAKQIQSRYNCYGCSKVMATQAKGFSYCENKFVNYTRKINND